MSDDPYELNEEQIAASRILIVDDDTLVTTSLTTLLQIELDVDPVAFNVSKEARDYLKEHEIDLVISDFLMPDLDGIQLLTVARELQPEVPRILLTGYADKENAIKAINQVKLFQYLEKPWENAQLKKVIINGLERRNLLRVISGQVGSLSETRKDLEGIRKALVRAFA